MAKITSRVRNIIIFSVLFVTVLGFLFGYNLVKLLNEQSAFSQCDDTWCVRFTGNVNEEIFIGISDLLGDQFDRVENKDFYMLNRYHTEFTVTYSGVKLWDILEKTDIIPNNATRIRFQASDGFSSYELPLKIVEENPDQVILVTHDDGILIPNKESGGDGPIIAAVGYDPIETDNETLQIFQENGVDFVFNTIYKVKYLNTIVII